MRMSSSASCAARRNASRSTSLRTPIFADLTAASNFSTKSRPNVRIKSLHTQSRTPGSAANWTRPLSSVSAAVSSAFASIDFTSIFPISLRNSCSSADNGLSSPPAPPPPPTLPTKLVHHFSTFSRSSGKSMSSRSPSDRKLNHATTRFQTSLSMRRSAICRWFRKSRKCVCIESTRRTSSASTSERLGVALLRSCPPREDGLALAFPPVAAPADANPNAEQRSTNSSIFVPGSTTCVGGAPVVCLLPVGVFTNRAVLSRAAAPPPDVLAVVLVSPEGDGDPLPGTPRFMIFALNLSLVSSELEDADGEVPTTTPPYARTSAGDCFDVARLTARLAGRLLPAKGSPPFILMVSGSFSVGRKYARFGSGASHWGWLALLAAAARCFLRFSGFTKIFSKRASAASPSVQHATNAPTSVPFR
mmetsp:Transcript_22903/g.57879  ORF Transcript_22903/g.57879 Transcript_22903/m.57879 type:complete len:419 (-) Transcript_22903:525-1781(-)